VISDLVRVNDHICTRYLSGISSLKNSLKAPQAKQPSSLQEVNEDHDLLPAFLGLMQCKPNPALLEKMVSFKGLSRGDSSPLSPMLVKKCNSDNVRSFFSSDVRPRVNYFEAVQHARSSGGNSNSSSHFSMSNFPNSNGKFFR
jgi:hypothetical protein